MLQVKIRRLLVLVSDVRVLKDYWNCLKGVMITVCSNLQDGAGVRGSIEFSDVFKEDGNKQQQVSCTDARGCCAILGASRQVHLELPGRVFHRGENAFNVLGS